MVCCTVVQYTCLLINDAHHKYLQATLNLDSCLEIHCMPNPFGEKIKKDHYSNIIKLVSNILLEIAECDYIIQTSDHLVWKVYPLWAWCEKKCTSLIQIFHIVFYMLIRLGTAKAQLEIWPVGRDFWVAWLSLSWNAVHDSPLLGILFSDQTLYGLFTPSTCHLFISMTFAGQFLR